MRFDGIFFVAVGLVLLAAAILTPPRQLSPPSRVLVGLVGGCYVVVGFEKREGG